MSKTIPACRRCEIELSGDNWHPSQEKRNNRICKACNIAYVKNRQRLGGSRSFRENKECSSYLGVHVAERVISKVFDVVEVMPTNNRGYDFICNKDKMIDVKSSCRRQRFDYSPYWAFCVERNQMADYFLCIAFDNREDLNPEHIWLLPAEKFNHRVSIGISITTISKWDKYAIDIDRVVLCCTDLKSMKPQPPYTRED